MYPGRITGFLERALDWLEGVQITSVKGASKIVKALCPWGAGCQKGN